MVVRDTAQIHLTPKTVRRAVGSHQRYWMDPFSSRVGPCPETELAGCTVYRVPVIIYWVTGIDSLTKRLLIQLVANVPRLDIS